VNCERLVGKNHIAASAIIKSVSSQPFIDVVLLRHARLVHFASHAVGEFKGAKGADAPPPNLAPTSSRRGHLAPLECKQKSLLAALGLGLRPIWPRPWPVARRRRLGPSQHDGVDPSMSRGSHRCWLLLSSDQLRAASLIG